MNKREDFSRYPYFQAQGWPRPHVAQARGIHEGWPWPHVSQVVETHEDWPIGSGPTESMAGVLTARIRGRGRRWDADHIDALMALQALEVNDECQTYWQTQSQPPQKIAA